MVQIAEEVWREWESEREEEETFVMLRFEPAGDVVEAGLAIRDCLQQVTDSFDARLQAAGDPNPPYVGGWCWLRVSDAVLVDAVECDIVDQILPAVAHALEQRGIEGIFRLREPVPAVAPPTIAHHLECRMRVQGRRVRHVPQAYRWLPDRDAHAAVLGAADEWLRRRQGSATCSIEKDTIGPIPVSTDELLADRMIEAVDEGRSIGAACVAGEEFRSMTARTLPGRVSLVAGGPSIAAGGWRAALAELTALLRELADHVVYAYVRRGWMANQSLVSRLLPPDWPRRPDDAPRRPTTAQAFEDVYAPDAFGVQLLGPGYQGRLPSSSSWRQERVGQAGVLLEHVDPLAWFDAPFVPYNEQLEPDERPVPGVLSAARIELAPLLYTPGILHRTGYADEPEL